MIARFIGEDHSMGFRKGNLYELKSIVNNKYLIIMTKDETLRCPYSSLESFLKNWDLIKK